MDALALARWQFGVTTVYHFFFVPITLGLSIFVAILETAYVRTGKEVYLRMTKFWGKLFLINFAIGVATGIVQEFQFGMNWSEYSRFMGDIFGAPLAIEALLAFYMESTFLGLWIFGWDKLSKKAHAAVMWLVAIGSNLSAIWILSANSFMQEPVGYVLRNGRAEMTDFFALITNPHLWLQFPHVFTGAMASAGFLVIGISAYHLMKKSEDREAYTLSMKFAFIYAFIGVILVSLIGHSQMQYMVETQPMKVAAAEALWDSENPASLSLFTIGDEKNRKDIFAIRVPALLSILSYNKVDAEVKGINEIQKEYEEKYGPGDYVPSVIMSYWMFRLMAGAGTAMLILVIIGIIRVIKNNFEFSPLMSKILLWSMFLPLIGHSTGWMFAEMGRQPWAVFGLFKTEAGVSNTVTGGEVLFSLLGYIVIYLLLIIAEVFLFKKYAVAGTQSLTEQE
jgi:cytochrome d ubiquinol oxidase subunit I